MVKCAGATDVAADMVNEVYSDDYADQANDYISSQADSFKSQADVSADLALYRTAKFATCFKPEITAAAAAAGDTLTGVRVTLVPATEAGVVSILKYSGSLTSQGQTALVYQDSAFIAGRSFDAEIDFSNAGTPFPAADEAALIAKVAARAAVA